MYVWIYHSALIKVRGQMVVASCLFTPCGPRVSNVYCQAGGTNLYLLSPLVSTLSKWVACTWSHLLILPSGVRLQYGFWRRHSNIWALSNLAHYVHLKLPVRCSGLNLAFQTLPQCSGIQSRALASLQGHLWSLQAQLGEWLADSTPGMIPINGQFSTWGASCFQGQKELSWYFLE